MSKTKGVKNTSQQDDSQIVCKYQLQHEMNKNTMIADCKECQGAADLNDQACLTGILNVLSQEYNVDYLILSHYIETKYAEDSMQMLNMMVDILHDLSQMSIRDPYEEYFASDGNLSSLYKNQQRAACEKCQLKPQVIFLSLKKNFLKDITSFYKSLGSLSRNVGANTNDSCAKCMKATKSDLIYLFNKLEDFRAYVIYKGFQIVI